MAHVVQTLTTKQTIYRKAYEFSATSADPRPELPDGCVVSNTFALSPDASTSVPVGTVGIVAGTNNNLLRHGFRYAGAAGIYYPLSQPPTAEYTLASQATTADDWLEIFHRSSTDPSVWTIVSEDRYDHTLGTSATGENETGRGVYIEFDFTLSSVLAPNTTYGVYVDFRETSGAVGFAGRYATSSAETRTLPPNHPGGTVYYSNVFWLSDLDRQGPAAIAVYGTDGAGNVITLQNLKILKF